MKSVFSLLNGPQTFGNSRAFWGTAGALFIFALLYPAVADGYTVSNLAYFGVWVFMALGLSLIWGYGGMLSFGQAAFFGLAGYSYGIIAINLGADYGYPGVALFCALFIAAALALVLGYFVVYGRMTGVSVGIVTLSVTLTFATFLNQTAGPEWHIGRARLNGYNGMTHIPSLSIQWFGGDKITFGGPLLYYLVLVLAALCYLGLRMLVNSRFGNTLVAIRENPERAELLGYDIRRYELVAFVIGSTLAGLSGVLYTVWGQFIAPASMSLPAAAMPIIWVAVGGRKDLTAALIGTFFVLWLFQTLIVISQQYALIVIGALLLVAILFMPGGYVVWLVENRSTILGWWRLRGQRTALARERARDGAAE